MRACVCACVRLLPWQPAQVRNYMDSTGQKVFFEYVMLSGVNDSQEQAHQLGQLLKVRPQPQPATASQPAGQALPYIPMCQTRRGWKGRPACLVCVAACRLRVDIRLLHM